MIFVYPATISAVHDGDTMDVTLTLQRGADLGFNITTQDLTMKVALRFLGYDAPELATPNGKLALQALKDILAKFTGPYTVTSAKWDKYAGRIDGIITTLDGVSIIDQMVAAGWLRPYSGVGPKPWSAQGT